MTMIDDIKRDRECMDGASWVYATGPALKGDYHTVISGGDMICECWDGEELIDATNAKRIARVPDMESALIAADELAEAMDEFVKSDYLTIIRVLNAISAYKTAIGDTR